VLSYNFKVFILATTVPV